MTTKATRKRKPRALAVGKTNEVTPSMNENAATYYRENKAMNAAKSNGEKARKALYAEMASAGLKTFDLNTNIEGKDIILTAEVGSRPTTSIDVAALRRIVTEEQFDKIVSASQGKVVTVAGRDVAVRCSIAGTSTENVSVKPKK